MRLPFQRCTVLKGEGRHSWPASIHVYATCRKSVRWCLPLCKVYQCLAIWLCPFTEFLSSSTVSLRQRFLACKIPSCSQQASHLQRKTSCTRVTQPDYTEIPKCQKTLSKLHLLHALYSRTTKLTFTT